ncbi:hypothetical protein J4Q44_G00010520 [Coregonus suidteri]|uniref:Fibronectin type-III domain-containing protein n=1 Tax=Coregonus suidteri TaxID=861788 RepID=A0AAN8RAQ4_9TELE
MVWSSSLAMGLSHVIMCLCVTGVWCQVTPLSLNTTTTISPTTPKPTPANVGHVTVIGRNETSITLQWNEVNGTGITYELKFSNGSNTTISVSDGNGTVTYTVSPLTAGTEYNFTLFTMSEGGSSIGYNFLAVTAPANVGNVTVMEQNETSITLEWEKVSGTGITYELKFNNGSNTTNPVSDGNGTVTYTVSPLTAGTEYNFTLFTMFKEIPSRAYNFIAVTRPLSVVGVNVTGQNETSITLQWNKVNGTGITYGLKFSNGSTTTISVSDGNGTVTYTVSPLTAGTEYNFTLFTMFKEIPSRAYNFIAVTRPLSVDGVNVTGQNETSITLQWNKVSGVLMEVNYLQSLLPSMLRL